MYCPECGHQNPESAKFCIQCRYKYDVTWRDVTPIPVKPTPSVQPSQKIIIQNKSSAPAVILLLLILGGLGVVGLLASGYDFERQTNWLGQEKPIIDMKANDSGVSGSINLPKLKQQPPAQSSTSTYESSPPIEQNMNVSTPPIQHNANVQPHCVLYSDVSNTVNVRAYCDSYSCDDDPNTLIGEYPVGTTVYVINSSGVPSRKGFTWLQVTIARTGKSVWVASSKVGCQ